MATYLVNTVGVDSAVATVSPVKRLDRISQDVLSAGDIVLLEGSTINNPHRGSLFAKHAGDNANRIVYKSAGTEPEYILASLNVSEGESYEWQEEACPSRGLNFWFENWVADGNISAITGGTSTSVEDTSGNLTGTTCALITIDAGGNRAGVRHLDVDLPYGQSIDFKVLRKSSAGSSLDIDVMTHDNTEYLQADGSFGASGAGVVYNTFTAAVGTDWEVSTYRFTPGGTKGASNPGRYRIRLSDATANAVHRIQGWWFETVSNTWATDGANKYLDIHCGSASADPAIVGLMKCTKTEWTESGIDALQFVQDVADVLSLTENTVYWDSVNRKLYYQPASGVDIADLHLEFLVQDYGFSASVDGIELQNVKVNCARNVNVNCDGGNLVTYRCRGSKGWKYGEKVTGGGTSQHLFGEFDQNNNLDAETYGSNGTLVDNGTGTYAGCFVHSNGDDGLQIIRGGTLTATGCVVVGNGSAQLTVTDSAPSLNDTYIRNCTLIKFAGGDNIQAIDDNDTGISTRVYDSNIVITYGTTKVVDIAVAANATATNNFWWSPNNVVGPNDPFLTGSTEADPMFVVDQTITWEANLCVDRILSHYGLRPESTLHGLGNEWFAGEMNPVDVLGKIFTNHKPTPGAVQFEGGDFYITNV